MKFSSLDYGSDLEDDSDDEDYECDSGRPKSRKPYTPRIRVAVPKNRENVYGAIPGKSYLPRDSSVWGMTHIQLCVCGFDVTYCTLWELGTQAQFCHAAGTSECVLAACALLCINCVC